MVLIRKNIGHESCIISEIHVSCTGDRKWNTKYAMRTEQTGCLQMSKARLKIRQSKPHFSQTIKCIFVVRAG